MGKQTLGARAMHAAIQVTYGLPIEDDAQYAAKLDTLGPVDVLFTHIPPHHPLSNYDVVARRFEVGSHAIVEYIERHQPRFHFYGHVHQPLAARTRIGRTESVNVGHFHGRERPFTIDL